MENMVKTEYDVSKVKQEMDINSENVEYVYTVSEWSEPVSLVIHSMQTNTQNTNQPEDYLFKDIVKSGYGESERKQKVPSIDFSEYAEDKYSIAELTSNSVSLDPDSALTHLQNTNPGEKLVKSEDNEIERKEEAASSDVRSTYTEDSVSKPTNQLTSLVDPFRSTFQINTQHPDCSEEYVVKDEVKSEYDETEFKKENYSIDLASEVLSDDRYAFTKATSDPISLVDPFSSTFQFNTQHPDWSEEYVVKDEVKSEYDETEFKKDNYSIDLAYEVLSEDRYAFTKATSDPISLVMDSVQINTQNIDTSEDNIFEPTVKYHYSEIDHKQGFSTTDFKLKYTQDDYTVGEPIKDLISLVDPNPTFRIKTQNTNYSENYNYTVDSLDKPVSSQIISEISRRSNLETCQLTHTEETFFSCDVCSKVFSTRGNLKTHLLSHTGDKFFLCDVCSKSFSQKSHLKTHQLTHTGDKFFSCDVCSKSFSRKDNLKTHQLTHTGNKFFSCDVCSKSFSRKDNLKTHHLTHTGKKNFSCDVCSKAFSTRSKLNTHLFTHTGEKRFSCDICNKAFSQKCELKRHILTHTGRKNFSCDICSKAFILRNDLKRHILTHTGEKNFSCDICSKAFFLRTDLKRHILTHTGEKPFSCDVCTKAFSKKSNLKIHLLIHTGEKSFSCEVCSKAFPRRSNLKIHLFTHTGEKRFSCDICSKACSQKSGLKRHILTHKGNN